MFVKRALPLAILLAAFTSTAAATDAIEERMAQVIPDAEIDSIQETGMEGVFEVRYGTEIFYVSGDGQYLLQGNLIDLETRDNLTQESLRGVRADMFAAIDDGELVVYSPNGDTRGVLNVFTDPNCPYCRELHQDIPQYLEAGIKVRYLMFPVLGRDSPQIMDASGVRTIARMRWIAPRSVKSWKTLMAAATPRRTCTWRWGSS